MISLNIEKTFGFISKASVAAYEAQVKAAQEALENGTGKGNAPKPLTAISKPRITRTFG